MSFLDKLKCIVLPVPSNVAVLAHFSVVEKHSGHDDRVEDEASNQVKEQVQRNNCTPHREKIIEKQTHNRARRKHKQNNLEDAHLFLVQLEFVRKHNHQEAIESQKEGTEHCAASKNI